MNNRERVRILHKKGMSGSAIAKEIGISRQRVQQIQKFLKLKANSYHYLTLRRDIIKKWLDNGRATTVSELANLLGTKIPNVYHDLKVMGFTKSRKK